MPLIDHVSLNISIDSVGLQRAGFGVPLVLSANAAWAERTRSYQSLADVAADFAAGTPEYLQAAAIFSQSPAPSKMKIGRAALKPTLVYTLDTEVVQNNKAYTVLVSGPGITTTTATYTSDGTATAAEIQAGLVIALNAVVGNNYLAAAGGGTTVTVTADTAGAWFSLAVVTGDLTIAATHVDPGVATDLAAIALADSDWYLLLTHYNSNAYVLAAAAWVQSNKRLYLAQVNETKALTTAAGNSDTLDDLATLAYSRTAGVFHETPSQMLSAGWAGTRLPFDPGTENWKFASPSGVAASRLTATWRTNLIARRANFLENVAGRNIMSEGTVSDTTMLYIDVVRGLDWLEDDLAKSVMEALVNAPGGKVPYTDPGIAIVESKVKKSLAGAEGRTLIDTGWSVTVPKAADVPTINKTNRILNNVKFAATMSGSINKVLNITGSVSF